MDYLSFLSLRMEKFPSCPSLEAQDYVILNSTSNVDKAIDALHGYERISCLLDNDEAGRKATLAIENALGYHVRDASHLYSEYNDLNDYLCGVKSKLKCPIIDLFLSCTNPLAALRPAHGSRGFKRGCPFAQWAFLAVACHCVKKTPY